MLGDGSEMPCALLIYLSFPKFISEDASSAQEGEIQTPLMYQQATNSSVFVVVRTKAKMFFLSAHGDFVARVLPSSFVTPWVY